MSVINQMLRDLDARQASDQERASLPGRLRTLPPIPKRGLQQWHLLALGIGIGAVIAGTTAVGLFSGTPAPAPVAFMPPAAPVAASPTPSFTAPMPAEPKGKDLARKPSSANAKPAPDKPVVKPVVPEATSPIAVAAASKKAVALPEPAPDVQIDKRSKGGTGRELVEAEFRKGMQAASNGDLAGAQIILRRVLEIDPNFAKARQALLSVLASGKQWNDVRQVAADGLALDPSHSDWAMILARVEHDQGNGAAAIDTLERHAAQATGNAEYQSLFAYLLQKHQRYAEAAQRYQAALALRPNEARWWFGLGLAFDAAGQNGEARAAFMKAREVGNLPAEMLFTVEQKLK